VSKHVECVGDSADCPACSHYKTCPGAREFDRSTVFCVGDGGKGKGCGRMHGKSGCTCPRCGGMLLSAKDLKVAKALNDRWKKEERKVRR